MLRGALIRLAIPAFMLSSNLLADTQHPPDWNDTQIEWHNYVEGLQHACTTGKPAMLFFYADWCPTCHAYRAVFRDPAILAATSQFIMIRINIDEYPEIDTAYNLDGGYVPRIFGLHANGSLIQNIYKPEGEYKHFLDAGDKAGFLELMRNVADAATLTPKQPDQINAEICNDRMIG